MGQPPPRSLWRRFKRSPAFWPAIAFALLAAAWWLLRPRRPSRVAAFEAFVASAPPSDIWFCPGRETALFLSQDQDRYVALMTQVDLYARGVQTHAAYTQRSASAATDVPRWAREPLREAAGRADAYLRAIGEDTIASIPWKIGFTKGDAYEQGLPHTRGHMIFLSTDMLGSPDRPADIADTLVHEKVHLYQRFHPSEVQQRLVEQGYRPVAERRTQPLARANPDLDEWIYTDQNGDMMIALYTSDHPYGILDVVILDPAREHPYEAMAYRIARGYRPPRLPNGLGLERDEA